MPDQPALEQKISFFKMLFALFFTLDISIIAYIWKNIDADFYRVSIATFFCVIITFIIVEIVRYILKLIRELKEL